MVDILGGGSSAFEGIWMLVGGGGIDSCSGFRTSATSCVCEQTKRVETEEVRPSEHTVYVFERLSGRGENGGGGSAAERMLTRGVGQSKELRVWPAGARLMESSK